MVIAGGIKNFSNSDPSVFHLCSYVDVLLWMGACNCVSCGEMGKSLFEGTENPIFPI